MRLSTAITIALSALLVTSSLGVVAAAPSGVGPSADRSPQVADVDHPPLEPAEPQQVIRINVSADGDTTWTIESRYVLEDDDDVDSFQSFADAVADGDRDAGYDAATFERFLDTAEESTDREMEIEDLGWDEPRVIPDDGDDDDTRIGVISYSVEWSDFTAVDDNRIYLGDAVTTDDGPWLSLADGQRLVVESPPNYGFENPPIGAQDGALVWDGPHEFDDDELEVTFLRGVTNGGTNGGAGPSLLDSLLSPLTVVTGVGLAVLFVLVGVGGYLLASQRPVPFLRSDEDDSMTASDSVTGFDADGSARMEPDTDDGNETYTVSYDDDRVPDADEVDVELLSDEERVHRLLRQNGGRMKQASIVSETGWSNAKVSQLLSEMDENDEIEKLRIGRENLITLPEVDPTEID
ncbi:helix-turn-helix transcriptional regulator [Natrialbaceae archaeon AArc-T1-2]|uniref:helix-turn-helix transcriptional regulator n=1 Tax=Natrialbaceae archaeon AArc-T1-2 TaxID=3053904 RepID=UPI00255B153B|nr:ABC transporter permease [Natrialbaceae archaeon AArc-T1-2]WIV68127.1 ABC transporter permease [Natrialbaceae archaeon AArc-T1-2]